MKRTLLLISAVLLSVMAWGQKLTLYMAGNQAFEYDISQLDSIVFSEGQTIPSEEIVVTVDAYGIAQGEHWFEKIDETNFYIDDIKYTAQSGDLVVTGYNEAFFKGAANIISVLKYRGRTMNVVEIWENAFKDCGVLTSVTIPESVTSIGNGAFSGCSCLTDVLLNSDSVVSASRSYNSSMKSIFGEQVNHYVIGNSVTSIGGYAFCNCSSLTAVTIGSGVTNIGKSAFYNCSSLTSITIPNSVTSIGGYAFYGCTGLTSVTIGSGVTSIGDQAFYNCSSLTSVTIGNSVTTIGWYAFFGCNSLQKVIVPDIAAWCGISFGDYYYANPLRIARHLYSNENTEITNLIIPEGVASIGEYAFNYCRSLTSVTIPESVTSIGEYAFYECSSLTFVIIPESVGNIGNWAFSGCTGLTSITIPNSVTSIGGSAFSGCSSLASIIVESGNTVYDSRNNCNAIIEITTNTLIAGCMNTTIPESVTSIGSGAFEDCKSLTSITIPNSVTNIGECAFFYCTGLTSVTIPNSVTTIDNHAFGDCSSLTSITIGSGVTSIGKSAFSGSSSCLTDVYCFAENVPSTDSQAFLHTSYSSATLHVPAGSVDAYKAQAPWKYFESIVAIE